MTYRDDRDAALARAESLERELAEKRALLDKREEELSATKQELTDAEQKLAADNSADRERTAARAELDALAHRGDEPQRSNKRKPASNVARARSKSQRERDQRLLVSVSGWAKWRWYGCMFVPLAAAVLGDLLLHLPLAGWSFLALVAATLALGGALAMLTRLLARRALERERTWATSRGYALEGKPMGYPDLLGIRPAGIWSRSSADENDGFQRRFGVDDHHKWVIIHLDCANPPDDLARLVRGFDAKLERCDNGAYRRKSPCGTHTFGNSVSEHADDDNKALRQWVRRLDDELLQPLKRAHGLQRLTIELG